jgi:hypothetical protein
MWGDAVKSALGGYDPMRQAPRDDSFGGSHQELNPVMSMLEQGTGLVQSESMHLTNDPRFFQSSVLNKRLAAFSGLSVVSGLMVGTCSDVISMKKDMNLSTLEGNLQLLSFSIMTFVLFANILATYVGVAQIYHTYRLETAGPTGFEMATSYYLNPNIVSWRHLAVKCMLNSLPLFLVATGIRIEINFERQAIEPVSPSHWSTRVLGFFFMALYAIMGLMVSYVHTKHMAIFRERYEVVKRKEMPYLKHVHSMMTSHRGPLDV